MINLLPIPEPKKCPRVGRLTKMQHSTENVGHKDNDSIEPKREWVKPELEEIDATSAEAAVGAGGDLSLLAS